MAEAGEEGVGLHIENLPALPAQPLGGQGVAPFQPMLLDPINDKKLDGQMPLPVTPDRHEGRRLLVVA